MPIKINLRIRKIVLYNNKTQQAAIVFLILKLMKFKWVPAKDLPLIITLKISFRIEKQVKFKLWKIINNFLILLIMIIKLCKNKMKFINLEISFQHLNPKILFNMKKQMEVHKIITKNKIKIRADLKLIRLLVI